MCGNDEALGGLPDSSVRDLERFGPLAPLTSISVRFETANIGAGLTTLGRSF